MQLTLMNLRIGNFRWVLPIAWQKSSTTSRISGRKILFASIPTIVKFLRTEAQRRYRILLLPFFKDLIQMLPWESFATVISSKRRGRILNVNWRLCTVASIALGTTTGIIKAKMAFIVGSPLWNRSVNPIRYCGHGPGAAEQFGQDHGDWGGNGHGNPTWYLWSSGIARTDNFPTGAVG